MSSETATVHFALDAADGLQALEGLSALADRAEFPGDLSDRLVRLLDGGAYFRIVQSDLRLACGTCHVRLVAHPAQWLSDLLTASRAGKTDWVGVERALSRGESFLKKIGGR